MLPVLADASKDGSAQHAQRGRDGALQEENALLKQEVQRLTAELVSPAASRRGSGTSCMFEFMGVVEPPACELLHMCRLTRMPTDRGRGPSTPTAPLTPCRRCSTCGAFPGLQCRDTAVPAATPEPAQAERPGLTLLLALQANGLLAAKVEMLRDNLKAARTESADRAKLEEEVARLKEQLAAASQEAAGQLPGRGGIRKGRSVSQDELRSQTQLWMQLVRVHGHTVPCACRLVAVQACCSLCAPEVCQLWWHQSVAGMTRQAAHVHASRVGCYLSQRTAK